MLNDRIKEIRINEYGGSEKKNTFVLDDGNKYLVKMPDPSREKKSEVSYINNAISEYIACQIAASIGLPVQETFLDEYIAKNGKTKIVCACKDFREPGEVLIEAEKIENSLEEVISNPTFANTEMLLKEIPGLDYDKAMRQYCRQFVLDAFIANPDRHNGNWGFLQSDGSIRMAPIYDCGSSLMPLIGNEDLSLEKSRSSLSIPSAIRGENGQRINYGEFLRATDNLWIKNALCDVIPAINMSRVRDIVNHTPFIADERKHFYNDMLEIRYQRILVPALEKIFIKEADREMDHDALHKFYETNLKPLSQLPVFSPVKVNIRAEEKYFYAMKISNRYAIAHTEHQMLGLLPIRSNDKEVARAVRAFAEIKIQAPEKEKDKSIGEKQEKNYDDLSI